jgi:DNA-directed RNA polymerase sigma subunit (sigma70/sigma32)
MAMRVWNMNLVMEYLVDQKTEENVTKLRVVLRSDRRLTVRMIGSELNLKHQTIHDILTEELGMQTLGCCIRSMLPVTVPFP